GVGQQFFEKLAVFGAKVGQQVIIHPDLAADPHVGQVALAQPPQMPGAADPLDRRQHPQGHQDLRIDGIPPRAPFDRLNLAVQRLEVERIDVRPNRPHAMILGDQLIERGVTPLNLKPLGTLDPNGTDVGWCLGLLHATLIAPPPLNAKAVAKKSQPRSAARTTNASQTVPPTKVRLAASRWLSEAGFLPTMPSA